MTENKFAETYKTLRNSELLDIIDNAVEYEPSAVEAATAELNGRQLTPEQVEEAKSFQFAKTQHRLKRESEYKGIEARIKSGTAFAIDAFNPIQKNPQTIDRQIGIVSFYLLAIFVYRLYREFGFMMFMFTDSSARWDLSMVHYFLVFLILPAATLMFWHRKKRGWILTILFSSFLAAEAISSLIKGISHDSAVIVVLDSLFPTTSWRTYLGRSIVYAALIWILCKAEMREIYKIDKQTMVVSLGIGIGTALLLTVAS